MAPARVGVIGLGLIWLRQHQGRLAKLQDVFQPVAFCDVDPDRRAGVAHEFPQAKVMADYHDLLALPEIDTVMIFTPIAFNAPIAFAALEAGKHVIMEKPIARSTGEGQALIAMARRAARRLFVTEQLAYRPAEESLAALLASGAIGDVVAWNRVAHGETDPVQGPLRFENTEWRKRADFPLGTLFDGGIHLIAALTRVFGRPATVCATGQQLRPEYGAYDHITMTFQYANGIVGQLSHSTYLPAVHNHFHIYGTQGVIVVEANRLIVEKLDQPPRSIDLSHEDAYDHMWQAVVRAWQEDQEMYYMPERAVGDVAILETVDQAIKARCCLPLVDAPHVP